MILLQIQNLDSFRKIVVDSVVAAQRQQFNSLDYINKVDAFYTSAWTKLAVVFALIGVLVPLIINYIQTKRNEKDQQNIKASLLAEIKTDVDNYFNDKDAYLDKKLTKIQHASEGVSYQIQSDILFDKSKFRDSFGETVNAMTCYFIGDDYSNFLSSLEDLLIRIKKIQKVDIENLREEFGEYYDIMALIEKLENCEDEKYSCHSTKLKLAVKSVQ